MLAFPRRVLLLAAFVAALLVAPSASANTGHWRTLGVASMNDSGGTCSGLSALGEDDGTALEWLACGPSYACDTPTDLHITVPDFASVTEAVFSFDVKGSGNDARAQVACLAPNGSEAAQLVPTRSFSTNSTTFHWEVPAACFQSSDVVIRLTRVGGNCLGPDHAVLRVKSSYRDAPLVSVSASGGTCGPSCAQGMTEDDAQYLDWIACSGSYAYGTPTDFVFDSFDFASVNDALLTLDTRASGSDARARIECVDGQGQPLATIAAERTFPQNGEIASWPVPAACFAAPTTTVRVTRTGSNCIGVDVIRLQIDSSARVHRMTGNAASGTCGQNVNEGCLGDMNRDDDRYLSWVACASSYKYGNPTDVYFSTPSYDTVSAAALVLDATASGSDAQIRIACVDGGGHELAQILPTTLFPQHAASYAWTVPAACFTSATTRIRFERVGGNCLGPDFIRLYTVSGAPDGFVINRGGVQGYADKESVAPGEDITFMIHAPNNSFSIDIIRYGLFENTLWTDSNVLGAPQPYRATAYKDGAGWSPSYVFSVPSGYTSGLYAARLYDGASESYVTFVVRDPHPASAARVAVLASSNTWTAYNTWGGASFYGYAPLDESFRAHVRFLSTERPNPSAHPGTTNPNSGPRRGHLAGAERWILEWLEAEGVDYSMLAGADLEDPELLNHYHALIISTHSEYWSPNMYDGLDRFLDAGGRTLYLSGNGIYWRTTRAGTQLEVRKDGTTHAHDDQPGGLWRSLGAPEHALIGVGYTGAGYCTSAPYEVLAPNHWLFDGTSVSANQLIGASGQPGACGAGASGWETDKISTGTPLNHVLLARGTNPNGSNPTGGGADMLYYERPGGGAVFSAGSINFGRSLVVDATLSQMVSNALDQFVPVRRLVPLDAINASAGTCNSACEDTVRYDDGNILQWIACSGSYAYGTPTDLHFAVDEHNAVTGATFTLETTSSGSDARMTISCVDSAGQTLAVLQPETFFPTALTRYDWPVPAACFSSSDVVIRVARNGGNCLGPDYAGLEVVTDLRRARLADVTAATSCSPLSSCVRALRQDDGDYLQWLACSAGANTNTELGNPTDLHFTVPDAATVQGGWLDMDAFGSGSDARIEVSCVDASGATLATIQPTMTFPTSAADYRWQLPSACFAQDPVTIRLHRAGGNCLGVDRVELLVDP